MPQCTDSGACLVRVVYYAKFHCAGVGIEELSVHRAVVGCCRLAGNKRIIVQVDNVSFPLPRFCIEHI